MIQRVLTTSPNLYEADETAWLEEMADLIRERRLDDLDYPHLAEYLIDMARRDRREVRSRMAILVAHLLKWQHQPKKRAGSWLATITLQRQELEDLLSSKTLRNHAKSILAKAYSQGVEQAAAETGIPADAFPAKCPFTLSELLTESVVEES